MKHLPLVVGIALPLLFVLIIVAVLYLPTLSITPSHDFVYTTDASYYPYGPYKNRYVVKEGRLLTEPTPFQEHVEYQADVPELYRYDVQENTAKVISREEAERLSLQGGPSSPDGYLVEFRYSHSGIFELFGGDSNSGYYFTKDGAAKRVSGLGGKRAWSNQITLIGWIVE